MKYREGKVGRLAHTIGRAIPEGSFKRILWHYYNRYVKFRDTSKNVERLIRHKGFHNGLLHIQLKNGLEDVIPQRLGNKYMMYVEAYELLMELFVIGIYEQNYQVQEGDTIIDAGAGWGFNTVDFSRKVGNTGKVIAVEPGIENLAILRKNLTLNNCTNVTVVEKGLWSKKGTMQLQIKKKRGGNSLVATGEKIVGVEKVEVDTLDNILNKLGIGKVALVKMDIEGAEIEALKGMGETLSKNGTRVVIASYHIIDGQLTYKAITTTMKATGFNTKFDSRNGISYFERVVT